MQNNSIYVFVALSFLMRIFLYQNLFNYLHDDVFGTVVTSIHYGVLDLPDKNNAKKIFYVHSDPNSLIEVQ